MVRAPSRSLVFLMAAFAAIGFGVLAGLILAESSISDRYWPPALGLVSFAGACGLSVLADWAYGPRPRR